MNINKNVKCQGLTPSTDDAFMAMSPRQRLNYDNGLMTVSPAVRSATENIPAGQRGFGPMDMAPSQWRNTAGTGLTPLGRLSSGAGIAGSQQR